MTDKPRPRGEKLTGNRTHLAAVYIYPADYEPPTSAFLYFDTPAKPAATGRRHTEGDTSK